MKYYVSLPYLLSINQAIEGKKYGTRYLWRNNVGRIPGSTKSKRVTRDGPGGEKNVDNSGNVAKGNMFLGK